ncbi:enoyl-CoA hydratase [Bordetella trematum]|uniref:Enoyl-CoA hydratase n=1 Tax=Bordetella trematum TaxID=123899 RepID=A0A157SMW6_9BORD|nr:enoyl-CoA hydratase [Bordetella trematum]AZR93721.1 enoyl-CoA hydratase [Bordetella trematum]NNH17432.1 enoyl-CoA hydratase [Bordetella trematum]SAI59894.1 enoyl-CoA hydratase [Bordetella trematum]SAI71654.1 enoyl-CoA hydratase [Bordetella trematum]SUV98161.1 enoyl-CoA hydratase [Bordetella trematum]
MTSGKIKVDLQDGIAALTVDNAERRNAMTLHMWKQLAEVLRELAQTRIRVLTLTGAGTRAFVSGADISEFGQTRDGHAAVTCYNEAVAEAQLQLAQFPAPTVALIRGACMGGGIGLALACDLRYASASASFRMPAVRLGLGYGLEDMRRVVQVMGPAAAFELFYTARTLNAGQAERRGLIQECFNEDDFSRQTWARVHGIASHAPLSLRAAKATILASISAPDARQLDTIAALVQQCFDSEDYAEGRRAFAEKREPRFLGL